MNIGNHQNKVKWAILAVFQNPQKKLVPSKYYLYEGENTLGSDESKSNIVINAEGISPLHAEVYISPEGDSFIKDLNSKQGIFKKASLNPNKKVRLEQNCRYSIIPDHEFYIGKYKCFIVAFDDDYKRGEERREKERAEIVQSQSQKKNINLTMELDETDLDEAENNEIFQNVSSQTNKQDKQMVNEKQIQMKDISYDKTLELSDRDENEEEQNLFQDKKKGQTEEYDKTLEIKSDEGDQEVDDLFGKSSKNKNEQTSEYDKTLEISSDEGREEEERGMFAQKNIKSNKSNQNNNEYEKTLELSDRNSDEDNQNLFGSQQKNNNRQMDCEKTLELSDKSDNDQDNVFNTSKSSKRETKYDNQYDKTLELSDRNSDEDNKDLFSTSNQNNNQSKNKTNQQQYDKTLELSDRSSEEDEKKQLFSTQNKKNKDMKMECEKTLELSDKDDREEQNIFQTTQTTSLPFSASQNSITDKQKRMEILKNKQSFSASQQSQHQQNNRKMIDENQSNKKNINQNETNNNKKMIDENDKTPDLSEEEKQQKCSKQEIVRRRDNDIKRILSPQPNSKNPQNDMLQETLIDEDSFNDQEWIENNYQDKNKNTSSQHNQNNQLAATLLDSPQSQTQSQGIKQNKRASPLSPTLVDDEAQSVKSLNQSLNSQKQMKKLKSPISLSPTFLDEEVNLSLLSVQNQQIRKLSQHSNQSRGNSNQSIELAATLIDVSDSKSKNPSPSSGNINQQDNKKDNHNLLQNTIIDSPQSQHSQGCAKDDDQNQDLMKKIQQQESELKKLKEQLLQQNKVQPPKVSIKEPDDRNSNQKQTKQTDQNQEQGYVINILPSQSEIQSGEQSKKAKNINLDKIDKFDDLFGEDDEEQQNGKINHSRQLYGRENSRSGNENSIRHEDSNSGPENQQNRVGRIDSSQISNTQQRNFGMILKKNFPIRTLTMSDIKKATSPQVCSTLPATIEEQEEKPSNKQQISSTVPQKTLFQSSDINSSDDQANSSVKKRNSQQQKNRKSNDMKEENTASNGESEDIGEEPKKKQKVQSNWVQLLKQRSGKMQDENSRNSNKSDDKDQNSQPLPRQTRLSQEKGMVAEDPEGNIIRESLKIAVSGFKLKPEQKKGIKSIKSTFIENNEDFDILVVSETKRTIKLLLALMKKKIIVNEQWLYDSIKQNKLLHNFSNYVPEDNNFKERFNQGLNFFIQKRKSIGQDNLIFEGNTFYISKSLSDPNDEELGQLIEAGGGQIRKTLPNKQMKKDTNMIVILGQNDIYIYKTVSKLKNVTCITSDAILNAGLNSEFEPSKHLIESNDYFKE